MTEWPASHNKHKLSCSESTISQALQRTVNLFIETDDERSINKPAWCNRKAGLCQSHMALLVNGYLKCAYAVHTNGTSPWRLFRISFLKILFRNDNCIYFWTSMLYYFKSLAIIKAQTLSDTKDEHSNRQGCKACWGRAQTASLNFRG